MISNITDKDDNHNTESLLVLSLGIMLVFACAVRYCDYRNKNRARENVLIHHNINNDIIKLYPENADEIVYQLKEVTEFKSKILNDVFLSHFIDIIESIQCTKYENDIPAFTYTL